MAAMDDMGEVGETLKSVTGQVREAVTRFAQEVELERRMQENPMAVLGVAAIPSPPLPWLVHAHVRDMSRPSTNPIPAAIATAAIGRSRAKPRTISPASSA